MMLSMMLSSTMISSTTTSAVFRKKGNIECVLFRIVCVDHDVERFALHVRRRIEPDRIAAERVNFLRGWMLPLREQAPRMTAVHGEAGVVVHAFEAGLHAQAVLREPLAQLALTYTRGEHAAADQSEHRAESA